MKTFCPLLCLLVLAASLFALPPLAHAQQTAGPPAASASTPKSPVAPPLVTPVIPLAPLATQLGQTLQTLVGGATTEPTPAPVADSGEDLSGQIADTFATSLLDTLGKLIEQVKANSATLAVNAAALPEFKDWLDRQSSDPRRAALWDSIRQDLLIVVGVPLLIGIAVTLFFTPLRVRLKRRVPQTLPGRTGLLASLLVLRLVPGLVFLGAALLLLEQNETHRLARLIILNIIYALSLSYTVRQLLRSLFAPTVPHLRFFPLTTAQAVSSHRWLSAFSNIIIYSYFLIDIGAIVRTPPSATVVFQNFTALILTVMAVIVIFQKRAGVASILRGEAVEEGETPSFAHALRIWLAGHWHNLATAYLIISLGVTLLGIENGFALMLRGTILSIAILVAARYGFIVIETWKAPTATKPTLFHRQLLSFVLRPALWLAAAVGIAATWGVGVKSFIATPAGQRIFGAVLSIAVTLLVLTTLYELMNNSIERYLSRRDKKSKVPVASARARTLLPMVRTAVFILFFAVAIITFLSAIGINVAPLLAGAGVLGVAIGFGSQTLVKDFLTGLFIVIENTVAVGDEVKIDSFRGIVETLSLRTIRLRDYDGSLHIVPFSEVLKITNLSKGFAYALVDVGVSYSSDLEHVMSVLREVGAILQEDPVFKRVILEPIEVMGVENLGDSSITIRARIRTRPGKQADVRRLLLLRIKQRFDKEGIEIPFPTITHITKTLA